MCPNCNRSHFPCTRQERSNSCDVTRPRKAGQLVDRCGGHNVALRSMPADDAGIGRPSCAPTRPTSTWPSHLSSCLLRLSKIAADNDVALGCIVETQACCDCELSAHTAPAAAAAATLLSRWRSHALTLSRSLFFIFPLPSYLVRSFTFTRPI